MLGWDVLAAFKIKALCEAIRKFFVYQTSTKAHGTEFWVAAVHPFGWAPNARIRATKERKATGERPRFFVTDRESAGVMEMMGVHKWLKWFGSQCKVVGSISTWTTAR